MPSGPNLSESVGSGCVSGHSARAVTVGSIRVTDCFLGVFGHGRLQLFFAAFTLQKRLPRAPEDIGKFRPKASHIDEPDRRDPGFGRLNSEEARGLAALHAAPKLPFSGVAISRSSHPAPWFVEETAVYFIVRDHSGRVLTCVYFER